MKAIVLDIEGTTTPIDFVHKVLFPYSQERLSSFLLSHQNSRDVQTALELSQSENIDQLISILKQWIAEDKKHPALKLIQGLIWHEGYEKNEISGQVYPDVLEVFKTWSDKKIQIGIYSSGSVLAQKLLFKHTQLGDLTPYLSFHFDTAVGAKKEKSSYEKIAFELKIEPQEILFASDVGDELAAAREAGFNVVQIVRPGTTPDPRFEVRPHLRDLI